VQQDPDPTDSQPMGFHGPSTVRLTIAVATFRRPECLKRILPELVDQLARSRHLGEILVVDNDPVAGARSIVERFGSHVVHYAHEPEPGISAARNLALVWAAASDVIVFIDDDELPSPAWLDDLVSCWLSFGCAGVSGPAVARFDHPLDPWVRASGVFDRWTFPTGTVVAGAASNNLLLDLISLRKMGLTFDRRFGISGGSDTMLTRQITQHGGTLRWCDQAEVFDMIPANRSTRSWVIRRTFRTSNTWSRVHVALCRSTGKKLSQRLSLTIHSLVRMAMGTVKLTAGTVSRSVGLQASGLCSVVSGSGMLLGAFGYVWQEYRRSTKM
jgi:succinoglycan biosynthesis protein ExoM